MNLLSIDFDFFFPEPNSGQEIQLYDWGHKETPMFINDLWEIRASGFLRHGLPLPMTTGEEVGFWDQFQFTKNAKLYVSESHAFAAIRDLSKRFKGNAKGPHSIWSFDAHHDLGYKENAAATIFKGEVQCGDWLLFYALTTQAKIHVRYPSWKTWAFEYESDYAPGFNHKALDVDIQIVDDHNTKEMPIFDAVFVCRSGAWVPSWCDEAFFSFLSTWPVATDWIEVGPVELAQRPFNEEAARMMGEQTNTIMQEAKR